MKRIILGITGASGSILAKKIIDVLLMEDFNIDLVITENAKQVWAYELDSLFIDDINDLQKKYSHNTNTITIHNNNNLFSSIASGSYKTDGMIIVPCSMGTLAKIATGLSDSLLTRAADVMIKEGRKLALITRETPLSPIHLENMLKLSRIGVTIAPPVPVFYNKPENLEECYNDLVGRLLLSLGIETKLLKVWSDDK